MHNSWKIDDFDSKVFGFRAGKITNVDSRNVKNLILELSKNKIFYATIKVKSSNFPLIHALEEGGFILVDGLINLSLDLSSSGPKIEPEIREVNKSDLVQLKKITTNLYSGTRITNDPLTHVHANNYYMRWIENSMKGEAADLVLVWDDKGEILGYVSLQKKGQIPLIGVAESARGKGIARSLLNAAFDKFKKWGLREVFIDTQTGNIPALRTYQSAGFKIIDSRFTFRWANR